MSLLVFSNKVSANFIQLTQDACLKAFWRKPALRAFLKQHSIRESKLATWHDDETKRVFLQRLFFDLLAVPENKGHAIIIDMAKSLAEMNHFPDLEGWEDTKHKISAAQEAVSRLRPQVESLIETVSEKRRIEERRKLESQKRDRLLASKSNLRSLSDQLNDLVPRQGSAEAGYAFERWFYDLANFFEIPARPPYKTNGRQIDGSINIDGTDFLIESKFEKEPTGSPDIDTFMHKIRRKADNTMGILITMSGFTSIAVKEASCDRTPMLLMDYSHLYNLVLSGTMTLQDVIRRIKRHASQTCEAFLPPDKFSG